ncbi:MAG: RidA family protein [Firmicutes bacterium]|uniref:Endoribonuclease L-PSP n=1 Tax=Melghirimyces thermohalophilus TaxID=1236220 RepID=A0A1G6Q2X9_9BACL|nr:RidA family protein [Melghirimyces thermohalophilus]MDA8354205.1 RidA family protein [Bacillota bacterium]SDC85987.1 endoribonuclease L-PSP [Melghirimyces thermohalophilus]
MEKIQTDKAPQAIGPYSQAVRQGSILFTSGQIPLSPEGERVEGGIEEETRQVLNNVRAVLEAAGSSLDQVIKTTIFLTDMGDFQKVNEVYAEFFSQHQPARSCVGVAQLPKGVRVEIEAMAIVE